MDNAADESVTLADSPTVGGIVISQRVRGLVAGRTYRLRISFTTSGRVRSMTLVVVVVE